ncbi:MAG TPA: dTDP-4-dehydrorhamnose 3,5-epimerase [Bacteroidia bacterium]|jgi:dTDP-4-dehydrorhamnose 3,5-epimerase|nr:dTDP-4-dehydrorhamnose 3,5-epimerase [Bacteroidia bacterium]HQF28501.1 dTDP-4-dehydrorhamnose 3,5-epimerase [Bacteroidia bacterium]HQK96696.1 dTDP-4-dehydrorhamnose 3,5-epimerase [Bacteroidia bacterium]
MNITKFEIEGPLLIEPRVFGDERGYFFESFHSEKYKQAGIPLSFVQDNESKSSAGVLRGLHFQNPPFDQGKLVRVVKGKVIDIAVDIRKNSATYGKHIAVELTEENKMQLWIPPGFAHGFLSLVDETIFMYKCTNVYNKEAEDGIIWNDPDLNINWGIENPLVSEKDLILNSFKSFVSKFV